MEHYTEQGKQANAPTPSSQEPGIPTPKNLEKVLEVTRKEMALLLEMEAEQDLNDITKETYINKFLELPHFKEDKEMTVAFVNYLVENQQNGTPKYFEKLTMLQSILEKFTKDHEGMKTYLQKVEDEKYFVGPKPHKTGSSDAPYKSFSPESPPVSYEGSKEPEDISTN